MAAAAKGKSGGSGSSSGSSSASQRDSQIKQARETQMQATDLLAKLLQAQDPRAVAQQNLGSLTEQFFQIASTYLQMVNVPSAYCWVTSMFTAVMVNALGVEAAFRAGHGGLARPYLGERAWRRWPEHGARAG